MAGLLLPISLLNVGAASAPGPADDIGKPPGRGAEAAPTFATGRTNQPAPTVEVPARVVSVSKQITAFADDQGLAAALATFGDKVKTRLLSKLSLRDTWRHPVLVVVRDQRRERTGASVAIGSSVYRTERGLKYQIDCVMPPALNQEEFVRELVQVLCSEIANQSQPHSTDSPQLALPPLWFTEGLTQNLLSDVRPIELDLVERAIDSSQGSDLKAILATGQLPPPGVERELFKAKCKLLVRALGTLRDGTRRAQRFLTSLQPGVAWRDGFRDCYGDVLTDLDTSEAWWASQLKQRSSPSSVNRLSAHETDERLTKLLTFEAVHKDPATERQIVKVIPISELRSYIDKPGTLDMVKDRTQQLEMLQLIAHQSYSPVLAAYIEVLHHVRLERFRKLGPALREAELLLKQTREQTARIAASLDKLEAEQVSSELLFLYRDYFQTFDQLKAIEQSRDSAIKDYLDRFQRQGAN